MKYKVGDEVRIKGTDIGGPIESIIRGQLIINNGSSKMVEWPENVTLIKGHVEEETAHNKWPGLKVELELSKSVIGVSNVESLHGERFMSGFVKAIIPPDGYIFKDENGNIINAQKIVLEKKKKEYPKTYEECCKVLGYDDRETYCVCHTCANERLFESLYRLKVCRDVYWKIAGDEMGLGKPWEPSRGSKIYFISYILSSDKLIKDYADDIYANVILSFPTTEMRDAFYENFKEEIEYVKELL